MIIKFIIILSSNNKIYYYISIIIIKFIIIININQQKFVITSLLSITVSIFNARILTDNESPYCALKIAQIIQLFYDSLPRN